MMNDQNGFVLPSSLAIVLLFSFLMAGASTAKTESTRSYPKEIRGYKVERTVVEITRRR